MNIARIRKALYAAGGAFGAAAWGVVSSVPAGQIGTDDVATAAGAGVTAAILTGVAVYFARNAGTVNGSDPRKG